MREIADKANLNASAWKAYLTDKEPAANCKVFDNFHLLYLTVPFGCLHNP